MGGKGVSEEGAREGWEGEDSQRTKLATMSCY